MLISREESIAHGRTYKGADIDRKLAGHKRRFGDFYDKHNPVTRQILRGWDFWLSIGQAFERAPKIAAMRYLDEHHKDWPEYKKRNFVRQHGGSPDFMERGTVGPLMDWIMLFHNPAREGWMSEADAFKQDPAGYSLRTAQTILPTLAFKYAGLGLLSGMGYTLIRNLLPWLKDEEDEEIREMFRAQSHYDNMNFVTIPIRWTDQENKKLLYLRIPLSESIRVSVGALMQPALSGASLQDTLHYAGGQVPGLHPIIGVASDWLTYWQGRNPYDAFTQRNIIDDTTFRAGEGTTDMLRHTWNELGGGIIKRARSERPSLIPKTKEEEFLELPIVQNTIGRWFKVSNAGVKQRLTKHPEVVAAGQQQAQQTLVAREIVERMVNQKPLNPKQVELLQLDPAINEKVNRYFYDITKRAAPELEALESLQTQEEKLKALEVMER